MGFRPTFMHIMSCKSGHEWDINKSLGKNIHTIARNKSVKFGVGRLYRSGDSSLRAGEKTHFEKTAFNSQSLFSLTIKGPCELSRLVADRAELSIFGVDNFVLQTESFPMIPRMSYSRDKPHNDTVRKKRDFDDYSAKLSCASRQSVRK